MISSFQPEKTTIQVSSPTLICIEYVLRSSSQNPPPARLSTEVSLCPPHHSDRKSSCGVMQGCWFRLKLQIYATPNFIFSWIPWSGHSGLSCCICVSDPLKKLFQKTEKVLVIIWRTFPSTLKRDNNAVQNTSKAPYGKFLHIKKESHIIPSYLRFEWRQNSSKLQSESSYNPSWGRSIWPVMPNTASLSRAWCHNLMTLCMVIL